MGSTLVSFTAVIVRKPDDSPTGMVIILSVGFVKFEIVKSSPKPATPEKVIVTFVVEVAFTMASEPSFKVTVSLAEPPASSIVNKSAER